MLTTNRPMLCTAGLFIAFIFISLFASAQKGTVSGTVRDANGKALAGASIQAQGSTGGVIADNNGNYSIPLNPGRQTIIISFAGFAPMRTAVTVTSGGNTSQDITLSEAGDLGNITVIGSRNVNRTKVETPVPVDVITGDQ